MRYKVFMENYIIKNIVGQDIVLNINDSTTEKNYVY
jgi:hypothetical protein